MNRKPPAGTQLDLQHPMAKDLVFFCACDRAGNQIDLVNNIVSVLNTGGSGSTVELAVTPDGLVQRFELNGDANYVGHNFGDTGGSGVYEPTELTIISRARFGDEINTLWSRIVSKRTTAGGDDDYNLEWRSAGSIGFRINTNTDFLSRDVGTYYGVLVDLGLSVGTTSKDYYIWEPETGDALEGSQLGEVVDQGTGGLCIGVRQDEDRQFDGDIHYVAIFKRKKSKVFINAFRLNPWQIFKPQRYLIPLTGERVFVVQDEGGQATTVIITDVDGNETWLDGATGLVISGSGFV